MTLLGESPGNEDAVQSLLEGTKNIDVIQLACTGQADDFYICLIGKAHNAGQIRCRESAVMARESEDCRRPCRGLERSGFKACRGALWLVNVSALQSIQQGWTARFAVPER